jgi:hypothetical protein
MIDDLLNQAVAYIKAGNTEKGKQILVNVLRQNPRDENAWLWMSRCVTTREQKKDCFERVLKINPQNQHAIEGLKRINNPTLSKPQPKTAINPKPTNTKSNRPLLIVIGVIVISIVLCICGLPSIGLFFNSSTPSPPKTRVPTKTPFPTVNPEVAKANWGTVDIRALAKNPDKYLSQELHYKGEVFSIAEDSSGVVMQVWVDVPGGNEFDREAVIVLWAGRTGNIYEGSIVEFWGYGLGSYEGTNAFGAKINQPAISAEYLTYYR